MWKNFDLFYNFGLMQIKHGGCQFVITRGIRRDLPCGRAVYRKESTELCLQHLRATENGKSFIQSAAHGIQSPTGLEPIELSINKVPDNPYRTIVEPPMEVEELHTTLTDVPSWVDAEEDEDITQELIAMLDQVRRNIKVNKN